MTRAALIAEINLYFQDLYTQNISAVGTASKLVDILNSAYIPDSDGQNIYSKVLALQNKNIDKQAAIAKGESINSFGDSITNEYGISSGYGYNSVIAGTVGLIIANYAVSGSGVYKATNQAYNNIAPNNIAHSIWMAGFNDLRRSNTQSTINKIKGSLRAFIANNFLESAVAANDSSVTLSGAWSFLTGGVIGDKAASLSGSAIYASTVGCTAIHSFTGNNIVIGTWAVDELSNFGGILQIEIDGAIVDMYDSRGQTDGVSDGVYSNSRTPTALVYKDLGNGAHTLKVTVNALTAGGLGYCYIDYIGQLKSPILCSSILIFDMPKMNSVGYSIVPNQASDTVIDLGIAAQHSVINEFLEYPVFGVNTNKDFNPNTQVQSDNVHPTITGHSNIARQGLSLIKQLSSVSTATANPIISTATYNKSYIYTASDYQILAVNRSPVTGAFFNTGRAGIQFVLNSIPGESSFDFYTSNASNATPVKVVTIDKNGNISAVNLSGINTGDQPYYRGSFSGTGTATTTFTVTIGVTQSSAAYKAVVSATNALAASPFYITNKTTTTFDVVYLTAITGAITIDWILTP